MSDSWPLPPLAASADPAFVRLHRHWLERIRDGRLPTWDDLALAEIAPDLKPHLASLDVVELPGAPRRYRFRLVGSAVVAMRGRDETGMFYDDTILPERYAELAKGLGRVVETGKPAYLESPHGAADRRGFWIGRLALPVSTDGQTVDILFGMAKRLQEIPG